MGYPKKYVGHYHWLAEWLTKNGFRVYPMEMYCKSIPIPKGKPRTMHTQFGKEWEYQEYSHLYGNVDVVAWKDGKLWAFECKNRGDKVKTAVLQTKNYAECFDYVCVVVADLKELTKYRPEFRAMGVGTYHWLNNEATLLDEPKLQSPMPGIYRKLYERFMRNTGMSKKKNPFPFKRNMSLGDVERREKEQKPLTVFFV